MLKIGLTGGICSGKSLAANFFSECGALVIDADKIAHTLTTKKSPAYDAIIQHFSVSFLDQNGELNRRKLREFIFKNEKERMWLEQLLHPIIIQEMLAQTKCSQAKYCVLVVPLLFETQAKQLIDRSLVVDCSVKQQIARIKLRDNISTDLAMKMLNSQISRYERLRLADDVIHNEGSLATLERQVKKYHKKYSKN